MTFTQKMFLTLVLAFGCIACQPKAKIEEKEEKHPDVQTLLNLSLKQTKSPEQIAKFLEKNNPSPVIYGVNFNKNPDINILKSKVGEPKKVKPAIPNSCGGYQDEEHWQYNTFGFYVSSMILDHLKFSDRHNKLFIGKDRLDRNTPEWKFIKNYSGYLSVVESEPHTYYISSELYYSPTHKFSFKNGLLNRYEFTMDDC